MANDNIAVQKLKLGIGLPNSGSMYVYAKQYDGNSRKIVAEILDSDGPVSLAGNSVRLNATLPNGNKLYMEGQVEDNKATFVLTADFLALDGTVACDISIGNDTGDGSLLTSSGFYIVVAKSNYDTDAPESVPSSVVVSTMLKPATASPGHIAVFDENKNVIDGGVVPKSILFAEDKRSSASANIVLQLEDASVSQLTDGMLISVFTKYGSASNSTITLMDHNGNNLCTNVPAYYKGTTRIGSSYLITKHFVVFRYFAVNPNDSQTSAFYLLTDYDANTTYPYVANGTGKGSGNTPSTTYDTKPTSVILGSTASQVGSTWANVASGKCSVAEGGRRPNKSDGTTYPVVTASGDYSHAEGASTKASGTYSHAQNKQSKACGESSTAMGASCIAGDENDSSKGTNALAAGELSVASGRTSIAMGGLCEATGDYAVAIGSGVDSQKNVASGPNSFALGFNNTASGEKSYAQGNTSKATNKFAIAIGNTNMASGQSATAIGAGNTAGGDNSVAIGHNAEANKSSGKNGGIAIGENVQVTAPYGVSLGAGLIPLQDANGNNIEDKSVGRMVLGRYNETPTTTDIITFGVGTKNSRKTALTIKSTGDIVGCGADPKSDNSLVSKKWVETHFYRKCLLKGTKILMADGTEKNIEDLVPGEEIMSYNPTTNEHTTGIVVLSYKTGTSTNFTRYIFSGGEHLTVYNNHGYYNPVKKEILPIEKIQTGHHILNANLNVEKFIISQPIYNYGVQLEHYNLITSNNLYFANGVLCGHNPAMKYVISEREALTLSPDVWSVICDDKDDYINYNLAIEDPAFYAETKDYYAAYTTAKKLVADSKKQLGDLDYKTIKYSEGLLSEEEMQETIQRKEELRAIVNENTPVYQQNLHAIEDAKLRYRNGLTRTKLFNQCCDRDNAAIDQFRAWLTPIKEETNDEAE